MSKIKNDSRSRGTELRVERRNARFQQWEALLTNRNTRHRLGEFLVQGVRPINEAVARGWPIRALLHAGDLRSNWARELVAGPVADEVVRLSPELLRDLTEKDEDTAELTAVVAIPPDDLSRIRPRPDGVVVVLDRPISPGNVGSLLRSADALGADGVVVAGRAADLYDPKTVRASRGSLFAVPAVRAETPAAVLDWLRATGTMTLVGTSEDAVTDIWDHDFTGPTAIVVGNETSGMSSFWAQNCDAVIRIPMVGSASSFNATVAASITLYEITRQRA
ncbi:TrmH family RNA methyltransferase [Catenuloplanes nepalensis]|uniref:TrmH family RNA methyltransferase n=1 Tax=Catenuloplanes nepalensis TaxID=587533 RepID=A0ABT9MZF8_9ACTN|nr:TrmH family RNA methyltransferase [Catenuloplanes nepalensis]MDP9796835.1 TrmH family RNA methyltransferase [Catenuloplanes nepalensis]